VLSFPFFQPAGAKSKQTKEKTNAEFMYLSMLGRGTVGREAGWLGDTEKEDLPYIFSPERRHLKRSLSHRTHALHLPGLGGISSCCPSFCFSAVLNPM